MVGLVSYAVQVFLWRRAIKKEKEKDIMIVEFLLTWFF